MDQRVKNKCQLIPEISSVHELFSLSQLTEEPTRVTLNTKTTIDHIATTSKNDIAKSGVFKASMSDRYMVYCVRKLNGFFQRNHTIKFSSQSFLNDVAQIHWKQVIGSSNDVNLLVQNWSNIFSLVIDKHAPLREIHVSEKYCVWINSKLKNLMISRDRLKKAAIKNKSPAQMSAYRHLRNQVNCLNSKLKKEYFTNRIKSAEGNMKETWSTMNQFLNKRSKSTCITSIDVDGLLISNKQQIASKMNE